ncbi:prephenate dehydratase [Secundilactobacillus oryzae]|uniref:prephenate dehydratase n=1 Tax=Secundilactobacillus oryzae TaxID=1202668 RepID=UPI000A82F3B4|nr:prephenate dehydratase domain-containing protein [Secundilactobacillus oryzae]
MKLSVLGPKGTFTDMAAQAYVREANNLDLEIQYYQSFDEVSDSVEGDNLGLLPLENQLDGFVLATLEKLKVAPISILAELEVAVNFGLIGHAEKLTDIKRLFVQFKTEGQCTKLIKSLPNVEIITTSSNIISLNQAIAGQPGDAAIVSEAEVDNVSLPLKLHNVADREDNHTRFIVFKRQSAETVHMAEKFKASLYVTPPDDGPGTLYNILGYFVAHHLNLVALISEPTKEQIGRYSFYIEVSGMPEQQLI